ncbi:ABC transporter permease [Vibrio jasicida]|uniref:response regulator receiver domain n=1 Tax=Vibrio jasicida TaxID=766224 RepID=UPI000CF3CD66|nr:response regulator receiver domain [Vibrio jasicida]PQJ50231.1 ABC transporter permease [Vibrio jasicida]
MSMIELIKEAYIDPIRSVMVVDDEYPTLTNLIVGTDMSSPENKDRLSEVITMCRQSENNWMLDVHDGNFSGTGDVDNLHHSDLLILDYHLEGNGDDGRGDLALGVLSTLAKKEHFNLVVVHTKGYTGEGADEGYRAVFKDIVFHLQKEKNFQPMPPKLFQSKVEDAMDDWELARDGIIDTLVDCISDLDFLNLKNRYENAMQVDDCCRELAELKSRYDDRPNDDDLDKLEFRYLKWFILFEKGKKLKQHFGTAEFSDLCWSDGSDHMWVKAGNLFVSVVGKSVPTSELPSKLTLSLQNWCPHPHRLLLAKLRHKLDEHGFTFASGILDKKFIQAGWLRELLRCEEHERENQSWVTAQNHLEELSWHYKDDLSQFLARVMTSIMESGEDQNAIECRYSEAHVLENELSIFQSVNAFNNSIPVEGKHLSTGHILKDISNNYFLVVTPACDLVPGRSGIDKIEAVIQRLYPVCQALQKDNDESVLDEVELLRRCKELVNSKQLIFLPLGEQIEVFCVVSKAYKNAGPKLMTLAFANEGRWDSSKKTVAYNLNLSLTPPQVRTCEYEVVGQLRYEYALHHSKVSGEHVSRIGLDYQA